MSTIRSRMKPNHPMFIELMDYKIRPIMRKKGMRDNYTDATRFVSEIVQKMNLEDIAIRPVTKRRKSKEIVLFWGGK